MRGRWAMMPGLNPSSKDLQDSFVERGKAGDSVHRLLFSLRFFCLIRSGRKVRNIVGEIERLRLTGCGAIVAIQQVAGDSDHKRCQLCWLAQVPAAQLTDGLYHDLLLEICGKIRVSRTSQQHRSDGPQIAECKLTLRFPISLRDRPDEPLIIVCGLLGEKPWLLAVVVAHLFFFDLA